MADRLAERLRRAAQRARDEGKVVGMTPMLAEHIADQLERVAVSALSDADFDRHLNLSSWKHRDRD